MSMLEFIKDKIVVILMNFLVFVILAMILIISNINFKIVFFVFLIWFLPLTSYMLVEFIKSKIYYTKIQAILEELDRKYLLPELIEKADFIHGVKLNSILKEVSRDMHENVNHYRELKEEYRDYIETWVHEIKTPIASAKLIIANNDNETTNKIDAQLDRIENFIEQVLYYSRSNNVNQDYVIKNINLDKVVRTVIKRNYRDFIYKKIKIDIKDINEFVYSDSKWLEFILNQIVSNAIKYSRNKNPIISIYLIRQDGLLTLVVEDNGIGIEEKDINRVFEKGFTGANGRRLSKSTGMGLYLCKKLCNKLGLKIQIESENCKGTKVKISF